MSFTPQSIANRLQGHPELLKRFDEILNIVEASSGNVDKASEAEQLVIDQLRHLGNEVIQGISGVRLEFKESLGSG